jgi:hypothetical protein
MKRLALVMIVALGVTVSGQERGGEPAPDRPDRGEMNPAEIQKIFDGYVVVQAQEALGLTDQQFAQFVPRLKSLQDTRRRHQQERMRLLMEMQRLTRGMTRGAQTDDVLLKQRLNELQEGEARFAADLRKAYNALDEVLDVRQQARFRVFEEQIERKKLDLLMRARGQIPGRGAGKRPPPGL